MNTNPQIYHGEWWVPAIVDRDVLGTVFEPHKTLGYEKKYTGTLTYYEDDDSTLELYHVPSDYHWKHYYENDVMWGRDSNGNIFTLFNVLKTKQQIGELSSIKFVVGLILKGEHVNSIHYKCFNKCIAQFSYLNNWLFDVTKKYFNPLYKDNVYHLEVALRDINELLEVELENGLFWRLHHRIIVQETLKGLVFNNTPYFEIESTQSISISSFLRMITEFEQFLSIALYGEQNATGIQLINTETKSECVLLFKKEISLDPTVFAVIKFSLLKDKLPSMLKKWHVSFENIAPISNYLIRSLQKKNRFDVPDFLIIAQALDGYHKRFVNKKDGKDHKKYEDGIIILLNQFKDLEYIQRCHINPKVLTQSRDKYSHLLPDEEKSLAVKGEDLYWLTEKCKILLTCCILNMLGLTNKEINLCCDQSPISQILYSLPSEED